MKDLDSGAVLGLTPNLKLFVGIESVAFLPEKVKVCESSLVICEANIIFLFSKGCYWGRSPKVSVNLFSELTGSFTSMDFLYRLSCGLCIDTQFAKGGFFC
jgi:hypothetical protein